MTLAELAQLGQFMGGAGVFITSLSAAATLIIISLRQQRKQWFDDFRSLYTEFWNNKDVSEARRWIASEKLYDEILKPVLMKLSEKQPNNLDEEESIKLDKVDKFIALLIQAEALEQMITAKHLKILHEINKFSEYWREKISSHKDLTSYIAIDWEGAIKIKG